MSLTAAEQKVRKLARLPANCICANCGTDKKFGFGTVCIKYFTFVCNNCKSSHQAISHRCKSLTMSSWSDAEAAELQQKGNDYARRTWLKNAPPVGVGGRPKEGDSVDVFKRFVVDVYERKRYFGADDGAPAISAPPASTSGVATAIPVSRLPTGGIPVPQAPTQFRAPVRVPVPAPVPAPAPKLAPVIDLLDFSSAPAATTTSAATSTNNAAFTADFDSFALQASAPLPVAAPSNPTLVNDPFQPNFDSVQSTAPATSAPSGFSFISSQTTPAAAPTTTPGVKKPVMSNPTMSDKSSLISCMTSQQSPQGFGNSMNMGGSAGGVSANNMNMVQQQQQMMMMNGTMGGGMNMNTNGMKMMNNMNGGMNNNMMMNNMNGGMNNNMMMNNLGGGGMNTNSNMGFGMTNGGGNPNMMMMMGMSGSNNPMMMQQQQQQQRMRMMNNNNNNNTGKNNASSMNALDMNMSSMNAWTTGNK